MGGKNAYLEKQKAIQQGYAQAGERVGRQLMADCMVIVLHENFGFGYQRIRRAMDELQKEYDKYHDALDGSKTSDYTQEKLDENLQAIVNNRERFYPFKERYPDIREIIYDKKH